MKKLLLTAAVALSATVSMAQNEAYLSDPRYGNSPEERKANVQLLNAFNYSVKLKDYPQATKELKELVQKAPASSENLYVRGINIYRTLLGSAKDDTQRDLYMDSLMFLFDKRAEVFADHATRGDDYVLNQKAQTFHGFAEDDEFDVVMAYFNDAIAICGEVICDKDAELIGKYFAILSEAAQYDEINADEYISRYEFISGILANHDTEIANAVRSDVESMFANSGIASCENLEKVFKPQFDANPDDFELVKKILALLSNAQCKSEFQLAVLEKYFQTEQKPEVALMLSAAYEDKGDFEKAQQFLNVAIESATDPEMKVSLLTNAAGQMLLTNNAKGAADMARKAMEIDPENALAAFMYANALMTGMNGCSGENRTYASWLVADAMGRAVSLMDDEDPMKKDARNALYNLTANFPKKTDLFMYGLEEGQGYTVSCGWVSGRTTVRGR